MDKKLHGLAHPDAVLTGVETRSSSPVRITRDETGQSINTPGIWPVGEGAGYAGGNEEIILCERGIRTFEAYTRNTLDISAVTALHEMTHLPVIVDPSHSTGRASFVKPMSLAATACGADGLMIEVHNDPPHALCDGAQSLTPDQFDDVMASIGKVREAVR